MENKKRCSKCKEYKSRDDFGSNASCHDGKNTYCRLCWVDINKKNRKLRGPREQTLLRLKGMKRCPECKLILDIDKHFYTRKSSRDGHASYCKECQSKKQKNSRQPKIRESLLLLKQGLKRCCQCKRVLEHRLFSQDSTTWDRRRGNCKDCAASDAKQYREQNRERITSMRRDRYLRRKYGMTENEYDLMLKNQNGACKICYSKDSRSLTSFHVDHCHETGKIRGLLCYNCNVMLGLIRDDTFVLERAIQYLNTTT